MTAVGKGVTVGGRVAAGTGLEGGVGVVGVVDGLEAGPGETGRGWQAANHRDERQVIDNRPYKIRFKGIILNGIIGLYNL
jgi:hypothetical protein